MAERRMFAKKVITSDMFLDMPLSTQALYFHLSMVADDEGFINNPKRIQRLIGSSDDDMKLLITKAYIIPFDSGIVVIRHWRVNNYLRSDRFSGTEYEWEKSLLTMNKNGVYELGIPSGIPTGIPSGIPLDNQATDKRYPQYSVGEDSIGKDSIGGVGESVLTTEEYNELVSRLGATDTDYYVQRVLAFKKKKPDAIFDTKSTILKWAREDKASGKARTENGAGAGAVEKTYTAEALNSMFDNLSTDEL